MAVHTVRLERMLVEQARLDIDADSAEEAQRIACQRADDGLVAWVQVARDVLAEAEEA